MADPRDKTEAQWRNELAEEAYRVTRLKGTEAPFSGSLNQETRAGAYSCVCCGAELFASETKFDAGCGWPSFFAASSEEAVATETDRSLGQTRTEILCSVCDAHLGHVFPDGPAPTGLRYCVNSVSLTFEPEE